MPPPEKGGHRGLKRGLNQFAQYRSSKQDEGEKKRIWKRLPEKKRNTFDGERPEKKGYIRAPSVS